MPKLAGASIVRSFQVDEGARGLVEQSRNAANRAIEANPGTGFAYAVRGLLNIREQNWEAAMSDLDRAIELNPNESNSLLWKGIGLLILGYNEEALDYLLQAEKVDPVFALLQSWIVSAYSNLGDVEAVRRHAAKEVEFTSGAPSRFSKGPTMKGATPCTCCKETSRPPRMHGPRRIC